MKSPAEFLVRLLVLDGDQVRMAADGAECPPGSTIFGLVDEKSLKAP